MNKSIDISVVMAEYNTPKDDLRHAIRSVLNQTYDNFEFIIIDDCGVNDVSKIVGEFNDSRIKVIKNPKNMGLPYSLNEGLNQAKGRYIVRMDTDDYSLPNRIETIYRYICCHPEYDVVGSRAIEFSSNREFGVLGKSGKKTSRSVMRGDALIHPSVIFKKEVILGVGGYETAYYRAEDLALWCKLLINGRSLYVIDDILLKYRVNLTDYNKRKLKNRKYEIRLRMDYYPRMGANIIDYFYIAKSICAGILSPRLVQLYRNRFVLKRQIQKRDTL